MASIVNGVKNVALTGKDGPIFEPVKIGDYQLNARYVYAPLTRCRALGEQILLRLFRTGMSAREVAIEKITLEYCIADMNLQQSPFRECPATSSKQVLPAACTGGSAPPDRSHCD